MAVEKGFRIARVSLLVGRSQGGRARFVRIDRLATMYLSKVLYLCVKD